MSLFRWEAEEPLHSHEHAKRGHANARIEADLIWGKKLDGGRPQASVRENAKSAHSEDKTLERSIAHGIVEPPTEIVVSHNVRPTRSADLQLEHAKHDAIETHDVWNL